VEGGEEVLVGRDENIKRQMVRESQGNVSASRESQCIKGKSIH